MTKNYHIVMLIGFVVAVGLRGPEAAQIGGTGQVAIVDAPREYALSELSRDLGPIVRSTNTLFKKEAGRHDP